MSTRPEARRALIRRSATPSDEEAGRFYADRVSDYAGIVALVFSAMHVLGFLLSLFLFPERLGEIHGHPAKISAYGFVLLAAGIWWFARRPHSPTWSITAADCLLAPGVASLILLVTSKTPPAHGLFFLPLLVGALLLVLRAALVPSTPARTAFVGLITSAPLIGATYRLASQESVQMGVQTPVVTALGAACWCLALTISTTLVSRVIYGLHHEIREVRRLGQYVLGDLIGEGGMGAVYRAEHALLRRPTAIKLLSPTRAGPESIARFEREVQLTARLTHPNTVAIYDYGRTPDGTFYYAMEYLDGLSLEALVDRFGPQPAARVVHILVQATEALAEAHALGLIHRDVKPANILFCERGGIPDSVKLVDFGLVKNLTPGAGPELTQTDALTGTPLYLAPESILTPTSVDHRVDIYALGGVAYFLLTGQPPFGGRTVLEVCGHHLHSIPKPPSEHLGFALPSTLEALVLRCLAKNPDERPADANALHVALVDCARSSPWNSSVARGWWQTFRAEEAAASPNAAPST
jgi:hypothetical protein